MKFLERIFRDGRFREGHDFSRATTAARTSAALAAEGHRERAPQGLKPSTSQALCGTTKVVPFPVHVCRIVLLAAAVLLFLGASDTGARFKDFGHRLMCTCGCGQVLLECNHVGCQVSSKMRDELQAALDRGDNDDLILQGFVQEYGPTVIAAPTATGFNRVAWIMPFAALGLGIAFVVYVVRLWKNRPTPALADGIAIPQGNENRDALDEFRRQARKETEQ